MTPEQARQAIKGHELAAVRNPRKAEQHLLAAQLLRKAHGIPEPVNLGIPSNARAVRAEQQRREQEFKNR
jgi:hypothetical protein